MGVRDMHESRQELCISRISRNPGTIKKSMEIYSATISTPHLCSCGSARSQCCKGRRWLTSFSEIPQSCTPVPGEEQGWEGTHTCWGQCCLRLTHGAFSSVQFSYVFVVGCLGVFLFFFLQMVTQSIKPCTQKLLKRLALPANSRSVSSYYCTPDLHYRVIMCALSWALCVGSESQETAVCVARGKECFWALYFLTRLQGLKSGASNVLSSKWYRSDDQIILL